VLQAPLLLGSLCPHIGCYSSQGTTGSRARDARPPQWELLRHPQSTGHRGVFVYKEWVSQADIEADAIRRGEGVPGPYAQPGGARHGAKGGLPAHDDAQVRQCP
jgi:hypothetical protein